MQISVIFMFMVEISSDILRFFLTSRPLSSWHSVTRFLASSKIFRRSSSHFSTISSPDTANESTRISLTEVCFGGKTEFKAIKFYMRGFQNSFHDFDTTQRTVPDILVIFVDVHNVKTNETLLRLVVDRPRSKSSVNSTNPCI